MRASDWVARYGGEEFVIVLPETNVANAADGGRAPARADRGDAVRDVQTASLP